MIKKDRKGWRCDKILVHFKKFEPIFNGYVGGVYVFRYLINR
jgi:hypothetical protein